MSNESEVEMTQEELEQLIKDLPFILKELEQYSMSKGAGLPNSKK
jgi:hypothetical protein